MTFTADVPDQVILAECKTKDRRAFDALVKRYYSRVYNYIARRVGHGADAEDLTQETFLKAFTHLDTLRNEVCFTAWLWQIATNLCISWARRKAIQPDCVLTFESHGDGEESEGFDFEQIPDDNADPTASCEYEELEKSVQEAIATLPVEWQPAVNLSIWEDMGNEEIAALLKIPVGTVKSRLFRARERLGRRLRAYVAA
jgi:RNA polymerase sigma-70 factor (ECF subfamily)